MTSFQFAVGERYTNNIGSYTVLVLGKPNMRVRYDDGRESMLSVDTQRTIMIRRQREVADRTGLLKKQVNDEAERVRLAKTARKANMEDWWFTDTRG
jgi:hypothetical protein